MDLFRRPMFALSALPARARGALPMMAFMFGAWKQPKPRPHKAIRQPMSKADACAGSVASSSAPAHNTTRPMPPSVPAA
ncbi:hypothetical protein DUGA6_57950 [Duganella sp. HH105]|nr:hypothetical protein DUGA6_57950 [Duganella sp. HH105]